jgi:hypothetical protein
MEAPQAHFGEASVTGTSRDWSHPTREHRYRDVLTWGGGWFTIIISSQDTRAPAPTRAAASTARWTQDFIMAFLR